MSVTKASRSNIRTSFAQARDLIVATADYLKFAFAKSQLTNSHHASTYLGRALR
jgi:hypothetical protein